MIKLINRLFFPRLGINKLFFENCDISKYIEWSYKYDCIDQNFEAEYLNPLNIFYVSQRNSNIQMNNLYQFNLLYRMISKRSKKH